MVFIRYCPNFALKGLQSLVSLTFSSAQWVKIRHLVNNESYEIVRGTNWTHGHRKKILQAWFSGSICIFWMYLVPMWQTRPCPASSCDLFRLRTMTGLLSLVNQIISVASWHVYGIRMITSAFENGTKTDLKDDPTSRETVEKVINGSFKTLGLIKATVAEQEPGWSLVRTKAYATPTETRNELRYIWYVYIYIYCMCHVYIYILRYMIYACSNRTFWRRMNPTRPYW